MAVDTVQAGVSTGTADVVARAGRTTRRGRQLGLYETEGRRGLARRAVTHVCAGCRAREARYGFRDERTVDRPRTLCFECFRLELTRRELVAARMARSWDAHQVALPLQAVIDDTHRRRRRAQIAARHALGD